MRSGFCRRSWKARTTAGGLTPEAAALTGLKPGTPITLGYVDVLCTGLGGGLYDPKGETGCTIVGSTGMHMKIAPSAQHVRLNAELSGYTMAFPVPGMYAQIQSNMASTLNIDWLLDLGRDVLKPRKAWRSSAATSQGPRRAHHEGGTRARHLPPLHLASRRARPRDGARGARHVLRPRTRHGLRRHDARRLRGPVLRVARLLFGDGRHSAEVRVTGGAARSQALRVMLASVLKAPVRSVQREEAGAAGAAMMAAVQQKLYPDMAPALRSGWTRCSGPHRSRPVAHRLYDGAFGIYKETREKMRPLWRAMVANRAS
jgi:erythritol kinase (D-erythritol 1-phosphate-forming)